MMVSSKSNIRSVTHFVTARPPLPRRVPSRAPCSHAPPAFRTLVGIKSHFVLHAGRVIKPFSHLQASLRWKKAFDPDIISMEVAK